MKNNNFKRVRSICLASLIAALYVALTLISMAVGLDKNIVQVRFSEMLIVLAFVTPAAIPGLSVGCLLANILTACAPLDIMLGTFATFTGACGAYLIGKMKHKKAARWLCTIPNVIANIITVTAVCYICYTAPAAQQLSLLPFYAASVAAGEMISCTVFGTVLLFGCERVLRKFI